ncbi:hypothetical protein ACFSCV_13240 [Methylopila henanensis]|uniref:Uncharacterized protein n=1 Tax=Methylopila henanensis TaxID=873516 RepID=A0ABW4K902_9HYPH
MLHIVSSSNEDVLTVYSHRVAIGGVTVEADASSYWALFALKQTETQGGPIPLKLGGREATKEGALHALLDVWQSWLAAAGLTYASSQSHDPQLSPAP